VIGEIHPASHFLTITRGTFSKGLTFADLKASYVPLALAFPVLIGVGALLLKKQAR
jgi:ribosome-dependent ATPase